MKKISLDNANVSIFVELDGVVHLVAMNKDKLDTIKYLILNATDTVIPTNREQPDLENFVGLNRKPDGVLEFSKIESSKLETV